MTELILTFDIGNTNPHVGWFIDGNLKQVTKPSDVTEHTIDAVGAKKVSTITSKVGKDFDHSWLNPHEVMEWRTFKDFLQMPFKYAGTLGADRLVQVYYLHHKRKEVQALVDAGTFTTVDLLNSQGHQGGIILPGLETYLDVFKMKGAKLPRLTLDQVNFEIDPTLNALNTFDAIAEGYKFLMHKISQELNTKDARNVIVTGGHAEAVKSLFPGSTIEPHLIHESLHFCLERARELGIV